jgi:hypothetical protein
MVPFLLLGFVPRALVVVALLARRRGPPPVPRRPPPLPASPFDPHWRTADVLAVARGIAADRAYHRLPILADALMDAGCADERIIGCCRGERLLPGKCWVVEEILRAGRP